MQLQVLASDEVDRLGAVREEAGADLGTLRVEHDGDVLALALQRALGARLTDAIRHRAVTFVVAVGEVEAAHVHPCVHHFEQHVGVPRRGADRAHDLRLANGLVWVRRHDIFNPTTTKASQKHNEGTTDMQWTGDFNFI